MAQVRLDADVADALQRAADRQGRSLSAEANAELRRSLNLKPAGRAALQAAAAGATVSAPHGRPIGAGGWQGPPRPAGR